MTERNARELLKTTFLKDHLAPLLNEDRSLRLATFLLIGFTLSFLALAAWFKMLRGYMWEEKPVQKFHNGEAVSISMATRVKMLVYGKSDIDLQRLLQSSSSTAGLIFTVVGFIAVYATRGDLARLLLGFVSLGSQVVFLTWIYVESWGEFANSVILTGTLVTAAFTTLSPAQCPSLDCLEREHSWEPMLITVAFCFILFAAVLNVLLAMGPLLNLLKVNHYVLLDRVFTTLDSHLDFMVDTAVEESCEKKQKFVSETVVGELVRWCLQEQYRGQMQEKVYRGLKRTELRVVVAALPTLALAVTAIPLRSSFWGGAAAVALMVASCSAMLFGFLCVRQREHRLPLCFSSGIDIIESFENATADLFGLDRPVFEAATWDQPGSVTAGKGMVQLLFESRRARSEGLHVDWETCDFMVIQTLGLAELGHFELQTGQWKSVVLEDGQSCYGDPNSNSNLRDIARIPCDIEGLAERRRMIMSAFALRDPVKIGPTAISKVAGVMMALKNVIHYMKKHEGQIIV